MPVSPAMAEDLAAAVADLYEAAEGVLLQKVRQALAAGIDSPAWVELKLAAVGNLQAAIDEVLAALQTDASGAIHEALVEAYQRGQQAAVAELGALGVGQTAAAATALPTAPVVDRLAAAVINDTGPVHLRILRTTMDAYRDVVARAAAAPVLGVQTRRQAAQSALDAFANRGVTGFVDRSGRAWDMRSYVEMAMRSAVGRAAVEAHSDRLGVAGVELVLVSQAPEECELCRPWERKILARTGAPGKREVQVEHATQDGEMVTVKVAGSLPEARAAGLMHPNCRHTVSAYLPGASRIPPVQASRGTYEDTQQQRYLERQVRKWQRREKTALTEQEAKAARARARGYQARIRELVADTGLPRKGHRERLETAR
ncbi:phage minor capsid protein [Streptomyces neyagawaensis]|uniref:phage minor capsid protein n=1 Tax=Streptomyces neyagawaensis TaxID=42238 RepID=UPI0006E22363|nr:phage minor capsid protein [Streptomyces neyagawaensis]MCL6734387.1 phage minor capsid protein [Streptomyces neyagawaensis]MDE1682016.1 capsid protein [Streptomyces neyagawaensis]